MIELGEIPDPVLWHEGMLLAPQHFQQAWRRGESLLGYMLGAAAPFPWGVRRLVVDRAALPDGLLRVTELEAILPDGLAVLYPRDGDDMALEIDLSDRKDAMRDGAIAIHLAAPRHGALDARGNVRRWRGVDGGMVSDEVPDGGEAIAMTCLRPVLTLHATAAATVGPAGNVVSLPLARLILREEIPALDESYEPPRLDLGADTGLGRLVAGAVADIRDKARVMAERTDHAEGAAEIREKLRSIVPPLMQLDALARAERVHPFHAYLALTGLAGAVAWFGPQPLPVVGPAESYRHEDPMPAFAFLRDLVARSLDLVKDPYRTVRFRRAEAGFSLVLDPAWLPPPGEPMLLGVRVAKGQSPAALAEWMENAIIASEGLVGAIEQLRIRGADRRCVDRDERLGLTPTADVLLYHVEPAADHILADQPLAVSLPSARGRGMPGEITLYLPTNGESGR